MLKIMINDLLLLLRDLRLGSFCGSRLSAYLLLKHWLSIETSRSIILEYLGFLLLLLCRCLDAARCIQLTN